MGKKGEKKGGEKKPEAKKPLALVEGGVAQPPFSLEGYAKAQGPILDRNLEEAQNERRLREEQLDEAKIKEAIIQGRRKQLWDIVTLATRGR